MYLIEWYYITSAIYFVSLFLVTFLFELLPPFLPCVFSNTGICVFRWYQRIQYRGSLQQSNGVSGHIALFSFQCMALSIEALKSLKTAVYLIPNLSSSLYFIVPIIWLASCRFIIIAVSSCNFVFPIVTCSLYNLVY
jgi:hypothetical protein